MKKLNTWALVVVVLLIINGVILALLWKQNRQAPPPDKHADVKDFLTKELSLTPGQMAQFETLRKEHRNTIDSLGNSMRPLKDLLFSYVSKPNASAKTIDSIAAKIGGNSAMVDKATFYHFQKLRAILNPDQQRKFDSIIQKVLRMMAHNPAQPQGGPNGPGGRPQGPPPGQDGPGGGPLGPPPGGNGPPN